MNALQNPRTYQDYFSRYYALAIDSLAELQNGCYKLRWEAVPGSATPLPGRGYLEAQAHIMPGSYIMGWTFNSSDGVLTPQIQITDVAMGVKFFNAPTALAQLVAPGQQTTDSVLGLQDHTIRDLIPMMPSLLPKKRYVLDPGKYAIQIWNVDGTQRTIQFVFWIAEPQR